MKLHCIACGKEYYVEASHSCGDSPEVVILRGKLYKAIQDNIILQNKITDLETKLRLATSACEYNE